MDEAALLNALSGKRTVYVTQKGNWVVEGAGPVSAGLVLDCVRKGVIRPKYSTCRDEVYWLGRTIDFDRTVAARKLQRDKSIVIYEGDT